MTYVDELDFTNELKDLFEIQGAAIKRALETRRIQTHLLNDENEVRDYIRSFIAQRSQIRNIAFSDGVTLYQLDLFNWIKEEFGSAGFTINQPLERSALVSTRSTETSLLAGWKYLTNSGRFYTTNGMTTCGIH